MLKDSTEQWGIVLSVNHDSRIHYPENHHLAIQRTDKLLTLKTYAGQTKLVIESFMPTNGIIFSDGIETDFLNFNSGSIATIGTAKEKAKLVTLDK